MEAYPKSLDPRTLARLSNLQLRTRRVVEGFVAGLHRSPFRGFSTEFAEHREYAPGDNLRYLDWKVLGRTDKYYLKQFEDETNLICYLVVDTSESMSYRGPAAGMSKLEYAQLLASSLAWLVLNQQDAVGLALFDEKVRDLISPGGNAAHLKPIFHALQTSEAGAVSEFDVTFRSLSERFIRRGVVLILSDFFGDLERVVSGLRHFRRRQHDVMALQIVDPAEVDFPFQETTLFRGLEGHSDLTTDPRTFAAAYRQEFTNFTRSLAKACLEHEIDFSQVVTSRPFDASLSSILATRESGSASPRT